MRKMMIRLRLASVSDQTLICPKTDLIEKLILNSGKIVGNEEISKTAQLPTA